MKGRTLKGREGMRRDGEATEKREREGNNENCIRKERRNGKRKNGKKNNGKRKEKGIIRTAEAKAKSRLNKGRKGKRRDR